MYTFGFYWEIRESVEPIAKGEAILTYLRKVAEEHGLLEALIKSENSSWGPFGPQLCLSCPSSALLNLT